MRRRGFISLLILCLALGLVVPTSRVNAQASLSLTQVDINWWDNRAAGFLGGTSLLDNPGFIINPDLHDIELIFASQADLSSLDGAVTLTDSQGDAPAFTGPSIGAFYQDHYAYDLQFSSPIKAHETYTLVVKGGPDGVHDPAGNTMPADLRVSFQTGDAPSWSLPYPVVDKVLADQGMTEVAEGATLRRSQPSIGISFNHKMDPASLEGAVTIQDSHGRTPRATVSGGSFSFAEPLQANETYTIRVKGGADGVRDTDGNGMPADFVRTVRTDGSPAPFDIRPESTWDLAGVRQTDIFPLEAAKGNLAVQMPLTNPQMSGPGETFDLKVIRISPDQAPTTVLTDTLTTDHNLVRAALDQDGHYEVMLTPVTVFDPQPNRRITVTADYLNSWPGASAPVVPKDTLPGNVPGNSPFAWTFDPPASPIKSLRVSLDGKPLAQDALAGNGAVTVDPSGLANGIHVLVAVAQSVDSDNLGSISRALLVFRPDTYSDLPPSHWAYNSVALLTAYGILNGRGDGSFDPDHSVTRAEFAKILAKALQLPVEPGGSGPAFSDVDPTAWYASYVRALANAGIVNGERVGGQTYFYPGRTVDREEAATMLARAVHADTAPTHVDPAAFADMQDVQQWARGAVSALAKMGWVSGFPDGTFRPAGSLARGQAAKLVVNVLKK